MKKTKIMRVTFLLFLCNLVAMQAAIFAQGTVVSGLVTDETGESLPGVNISIKGTTTGVISDINGNYSISVPGRDATLVFSYIGYATQEVAVKDQRTINVRLNEDSQQIEEVVVIGYGTVKKSNLTSSVSKIGNESITERPITQLSDALAGQLAGVRAQNTSGLPGEDMQIRIRGLNSINGDSS
ncbi:MAG: carboxypeptidase-like regulatory domain-containing protein, partial [Tannerella sp.]|nr:carboxypeptidase-like regulatory domain-containing protein [Tannerella sp.]